MMEYNPENYKAPDESVIYKKASGVNLFMNIYYPGNCMEKTPVALCVHGGGWNAVEKEYDKWQGDRMRPQAGYYADKGYIGIEFTYRSISLDEVDVTDIVEDCEDAVRYIRKNIEKADVDNMFAIGDSAGGHLVLCLAFSKDKAVRPKVVIPCNPVVDCVCEKWAYISEDENIRRAYSPLFNVEKSESSFLVIHGTADTVVPYETSVEFVEKMKNLGNDIELMSIEGAPHAFIIYDYVTEKEDVDSYMKKIDEYLDKKLNALN